VIRTSIPHKIISPENIVKNYKNLSKVEYAFRTLKGPHITIQLIRHRREYPVRAHIFLCMLVYYIEWHMRKALKSLLFDDEEIDKNQDPQNPGIPYKPSNSVKRKKNKRLTEDGLPIHSFETLLQKLATLNKNFCVTKSEQFNQEFVKFTEPTPFQEKVFKLLKMYPVNEK